MLLFWLILVLLISKLLGGNFSNLAQLRLQGRQWLFLIVAGQLISFTILRQVIPALAGVIVVATYLGLLAIAWLNLQLPGVPIILLGIFLNFLVITINGGVMPITTQALAATSRTARLEAPVAGTTATSVAQSKAGVVSEPKLLFLGDVIVIPLPDRWASTLSIGDILMGIGVTWFCLVTLQVPLITVMARHRFFLSKKAGPTQPSS